MDPNVALAVLNRMPLLISPVERDIYGQFEAIARERLRKRDEEDWPVLATAPALECGVWTEHSDFFGAGIPTWTTDRVELLLARTEIGSDPDR